MSFKSIFEKYDVYKECPNCKNKSLIELEEGIFVCDNCGKEYKSSLEEEYRVRPSGGKFAVFKTDGDDSADILFTGTEEECYAKVDELKKKESLTEGYSAGYVKGNPYNADLIYSVSVEGPFEGKDQKYNLVNLTLIAGKDYVDSYTYDGLAWVDADQWVDDVQFEQFVWYPGEESLTDVLEDNGYEKCERPTIIWHYDEVKDDWYRDRNIEKRADAYLKESWSDASYKDYESIDKFVRENDGPGFVELVDYEDGPLDTSIITVKIDGDWKHDHARFDYLVKQWAAENNRKIIKIEQRAIGHPESDWYEAYHTIYIAKDDESYDMFGKMRPLFANESLKEDYDISIEVREEDGLIVIYQDGEVRDRFPSIEAAEDAGWIISPVEGSIFFDFKNNNLVPKDVVEAGAFKFVYDDIPNQNDKYITYFWDIYKNNGNKTKKSNRLSIYIKEDVSYPYHEDSNDKTVVSFAYNNEFPFKQVSTKDYLKTPKQYDLEVLNELNGLVESLSEDTIKQNGKWVNKGKEGTHGTFKTKKEADAQRRAMFAHGYKEDLKEDRDTSAIDLAKTIYYIWLNNSSRYLKLGDLRAKADNEINELSDKEIISLVREYLSNPEHYNLKASKKAISCPISDYKKMCLDHNLVYFTFGPAGEDKKIENPNLEEILRGIDKVETPEDSYHVFGNSSINVNYPGCGIGRFKSIAYPVQVGNELGYFIDKEEADLAGLDYSGVKVFDRASVRRDLTGPQNWGGFGFYGESLKEDLYDELEDPDSIAYYYYRHPYDLYDDVLEGAVDLSDGVISERSLKLILDKADYTEGQINFIRDRAGYWDESLTEDKHFDYYDQEVKNGGYTEEEIAKVISIADDYESKADKGVITYDQMDEVASQMGLEEMSDSELRRAWDMYYDVLSRESFRDDGTSDSLDNYRKYSDACSAFAEVINREARRRKEAGNYNPDNESLNEADYGGAFDIENDQFFTKEELMEFIYSLAEEFSDWVEDEVYITNLEMTTPTHLTASVALKDEGADFTADVDIDMRRIRKPSHIYKYSDDILNQWKESYKEYHDLEEAVKNPNFDREKYGRFFDENDHLIPELAKEYFDLVHQEQKAQYDFSNKEE